MITASAAPTALDPARTRALVDDVLGRAVGIPAPMPAPRRPSVAPWLVAAMTSTLAVAAAIVLFLSRHQLSTVHVEYPRAAIAPLSHPSDALIGAIARDQSGNAAGRIDAIFADRLDGYRERRLARHHEHEVKP